MKEVELAARVVTYMEDLGFDVYQEVRGPYGSDGTADIVGLRGPAVVVVECKMTLGLDVIAQALRWHHAADYRVVAVPKPSYRRDSSRAAHLAQSVCRERGIGLWRVSGSADSDYERAVEEVVAPKRNRIFARRSVHWNLDPAQKTFAPAGSANGSAWSPWRRTQLEVTRAVREKPGMTTREVVEAVRHHYRTDALARSALPAWVRGLGYGGKCLLPEVEVRKDGGKFRWFPRMPEGGREGER